MQPREPHKIDYRTPEQLQVRQPLSDWKPVAVVLWICVGFGIVITAIALVAKIDVLSSIQSKLVDGRDVTEVVSGDILITAFLAICAVLASARAKREK